MDMFIRTGGIHFPYEYWYLISVYSDEGPFIDICSTPLLKNFGYKDGLSLDFWDISPVKHGKIKERYPEAIFFDESHAKKIIKFVDEIQKSKESYPLVVHCAAGISRSGAIGTFVCDYCKLDYHKFMKANPYIMANPHVLRVLRSVAGMTPDFGSHDGIDVQPPTDKIF